MKIGILMGDDIGYEVVPEAVKVLSAAAKIAKCFFVDTTGLVGLIRAASLSGLGLSRAGLAWINRRMTDQNNLY